MNEDLLLDNLPPSWVPWVRLVAEISFFLSLVAIPMKALLGPPKPGADSRWKQLVFWAMRVVDVLALNTTTIREKSRQARTRVAPPRSGVPPVTLLLVLGLAFASPGCASALHTHAVAADTSASLIEQTRLLIERELRAAEEAALARSPTREQAAQAVADLRRAHAPIESAYEALRLAHEAYVAAIVHAEAQGHDEPSLPAIGALRAAWAALIELARASGVALPAGAPALPGGG